MVVAPQLAEWSLPTQEDPIFEFQSSTFFKCSVAPFVRQKDVIHLWRNKQGVLQKVVTCQWENKPRGNVANHTLVPQVGKSGMNGNRH